MPRVPPSPSSPLASWSALAASAGADRYRLLAGATTDVLWDWDLVSGRVERNDSLSTAFGYDQSEIEQTRDWWNHRIHPDDRAGVGRQVTDAISRHGAFTLEYRFRRADGMYATVLDRGWIMRDIEGRAVRAVGSCVDVTERKVLESDLRRKTERLATMMEMQRELATTNPGIAGALERVAERTAHLAHADGAAIALLDGDVLEFRATFGATFATTGTRFAEGDAPVAEVLRLREPLLVWDVSHDARFSAIAAGAVRSLAVLPLMSEGQVMGVLSVHGLGPRVFETEEVQALSVVAGVVSAAIANARRFDENQRLLAERTEALAAVLESEERYRTVTDGTDLRIAVIDAEQRYRFANRTICEVHRRPADEILGRTMGEVISPLNYARIQPYVLRALAGEEQHFDVEWDIPGEIPRVLTTRYVPRRDAAGAVTGFYVISSDETERRRLQEQVQRTQRLEAVGQLAGGIAHDFNNLLTVIGGFAQVLALDSRLADDQRADLDEVVRATRRAGDLTRRLLAFGRKQTLQPMLMDLNGVIKDNERMLRRLVREDIALDCDLARDAGSVYADPRQIEHVLVNLVVNARDAVRDAGRITIETRAVSAPAGSRAGTPAGSWVRLRVIDTGVGMNPEVLERAFEPFFTTKPSGEGTGLGLAMVYGIVEQSGGLIRAESAPGAGTTFTIHFPRAAPVAAAGRTPLSTPTVVSDGEVVLVAEDEEPVRVLARRVLERAGYHVLLASNGREALEILESEHGNVDLIVSDIVMPEMGGLELAEHARTRRPDARVLFMSGYAGAEIERRGGLPDDAQFLQKPFGPAALASAVRNAIARSA